MLTSTPDRKEREHDAENSEQLTETRVEDLLVEELGLTDKKLTVLSQKVQCWC
jgi:hypothetical protein